MRRIPFVGPICGGAKSFSETVLADKGRSFKQVVLIRFPYEATYSIRFITAEKLEEIQAKTAEDVICVVVPHAEPDRWLHRAGAEARGDLTSTCRSTRPSSWC